MGPAEAFYFSPLQHPLLLWLAAALGVALLLVRRGLHPSLRRYGLALGALSALDAWLTSSPVPGLGALEESTASALSLAFVLAGDFRYLLLIGAGTPDGRLEPGARSLAAAAALVVWVPLLSQLAAAWLPAVDGPRALFLSYELLFLGLAAALARWHPRVRRTPWLGSLSRFVMLYYGLWALADAILLATGADLAFGLRVIPNLLYYGGLIAAVAWLAPAPGRWELP